MRGPDGIEIVSALVDTGFNGALTLPHSAVDALGLVRQSDGGATLADGSVRHFETFAAEVSWGDVWRPVLIAAIGKEVLIGMRLLANHKLQIAVKPGGLVEIEPLS